MISRDTRPVSCPQPGAALLSAARELVRAGRADARLTLAGDPVPIAAFHGGQRRLLTTVAAGWGWPGDAPDLVGELLLRAPDRRLEVCFDGWWSPVGVVELIGMPAALERLGPCWTFSDPWVAVGSAPVLRADVASVTAWDGAGRLDLDSDDAVAELLR